MSEKANSERRRSHRYTIEQMVQVSGLKDEFLNATSVNISEHGLSCTCAEEIDPSGRLFLILGLGAKATIKVESVVVWTNKKKNWTELGVEFTSMSPKHAKVLRDFLTKP